MGNALVKAAVTGLGINWAAFIVASALKTEKFYDITGSLTFLVLIVQSLAHRGTFFPRQFIQSNLIATWAVRLGSFLFFRIMQAGKDGRFDKIKVNPKIFFIAWTLQAIWVWVCLLPTLILNSKQKDRPLGMRDYVGWSLWLVGMALEVLADYQKFTFRSIPDNQGKWINTGLWGVVRHPNYLGEIMLWGGLFISASSVFGTADYMSVLAPIYIALQLIHLSGINMLERRALRKWGEDANFQAYMRSTYRLIPYIY